MGEIKLTNHDTVGPNLIHRDVDFDIIGPISGTNISHLGCDGDFSKPEMVVSANDGNKACFQWVGGGGIEVCSTLLLGMVHLVIVLLVDIPDWTSHDLHDLMRPHFLRSI